MKAAMIALVAALALSACSIGRVRAQDSFVPTGLKSTCEWVHGERCVPRSERRRVRERIVRVPVPYRVYRPSDLPGLYGPRGERIAGWHRDMVPGTSGSRRAVDEPCKTDPRDFVTVLTDPKLVREARDEAIRRWQSYVQSKFGDVWMDWKRAKKRPDAMVCWLASTGERSTDGKHGRHEKCEARAMPCRGDLMRTRDAGEDGVDVDDGDHGDDETITIPIPRTPTR